MTRIVGTFQTEKASQYLQQLCKHFAHKVHAEYSETKGFAELPVGPTHLEASPTDLTVRIDLVEPKKIVLAHYIIDDHMQRFAHREGFIKMDWVELDD